MNAPLSLPPVRTAVIALFPDDGSTGARWQLTVS